MLVLRVLRCRGLPLRGRLMLRCRSLALGRCCLPLGCRLPRWRCLPLRWCLTLRCCLPLLWSIGLPLWRVVHLRTRRLTLNTCWLRGWPRSSTCIAATRCIVRRHTRCRLVVAPVRRCVRSCIRRPWNIAVRRSSCRSPVRARRNSSGLRWRGHGLRRRMQRSRVYSATCGSGRHCAPS